MTRAAVIGGPFCSMSAKTPTGGSHESQLWTFLLGLAVDRASCRG